MPDNRHKRSVDATSDPNENLGFVVNFRDPDSQVEGVYSDDPVDVRIKPSPLGFQIDAWWTDEGGERQQNSTHLRIGDNVYEGE